MDYSTLPADIRGRHPYHMYDEIQAQPEAVARSLDLVERDGGEIVTALRRARRIWVTGCGTSYHAAEVGAWMLRSFSRGEIDVQAMQAFDLATYLPSFRADDAVIGLSHAGGTLMTIRALEQARDAGAVSVAVTGFPESKVSSAAEYVMPTGYPDERSWAHTVSYTAALATLAGIANQLCHPDERVDLSPLPEVVNEALGLEELAHRLAASVIVSEGEERVGGILLIGAGPNAFTAREGALKLLETSYGAVQTFELEQVLHGPLAAVSPRTLVLLMVGDGPAVSRAQELVAALEQIGVTPVVLCGEGNVAAFESSHRFVLPELPETLSPIAYVVPLQIFSYFLSVGKGLNPDLIHRDEERYRLAAAAYE